MESLVLVAGIVAYNNVLNRWPPFKGALYVPVNLLAAALLAAAAVGPLGLETGELGLGELGAEDLLIGAGIGAAVIAPLFLLLDRARLLCLVADRRVEGLGGAALAFQLSIRIPFGTALLEELAFRGVIFASLRPLGVLASALVSSAAFGLWHIAPTVDLVRINRPEASRAVTAAAVLAAIFFTTLAGVALIALRLLTGGLAAPFALHSTVNALGAALAVVAVGSIRPATS